MGADQVPVKRLQMAEVEDNPVALGNGSVIQGIRLNQSKKIVGEHSGVSQMGE
jgi:hypothetical protein